MIQYTISGAPVPKGRPRFRIVTPKGKPPFVSTYTPQDTQAYEARVRQQAKLVMAGRFPSAAPVEVMMEMRMQIPVSWSKKKQIAAAAGQVRATNKSDIDNLAKIHMDAMNGIVWVDDSQVVVLTVRKLYAAEPCVIVAVRQVEGDAA